MLTIIDRARIINVLYTVVGNSFSAWVSTMIAERNEELARKQNLLIDMDPEIADAFTRSANISTSNGSAAHLLKAGSKRRRT